MIGFKPKMEDETSKTKNTRRRSRFSSLFPIKDRPPSLQEMESLSSDGDMFCLEDHEANVRRFINNEVMFRKMQETLRESNFLTNQGIKYVLFNYFR